MSSTNQSLLHYEQGKLCYQNKKFQDAIFQFSEAIRLKPDNPQHMARCYNARGVVHFYLGEFGKVIKDCTRALQMDPQNANYYNCRGNAYFSLGKFDKAAGDFTMAIQLSPETSHGRYFNNRGSAYRRLKMFKEAIDDYTAAIAVDSKNGNYYNNRGNTYFDMGEFQLAIDDFTTALGLEPYSPKTKLTLAQAHEALAQEKRMKNITQFTGEFSHLKGDKKEKGKTHRKHRTCAIYVSPKGVEITYTKGWRKVKKTESFAWSEQMVIELVNENQLKLYLDTKGDSWLLITPCEATAVEEELIGRITTKFASYSTACLVAQHERVVNEYLNILKNIKEAESQRALFDMIAQEAEKQQDQFVKNEKFELAEKSKAQRVKMLEQINQKKEYIAQEMDRAEAVRQKAEQEAGPVLDMVLIMQNRVRELYHTRVKGVKDKYKVEDLELEEQLVKMENLVNRAKELGNMVAKPVEKAQEEDVNDFDEEEAEEANQYWKKDGQEGAAAPTSGEPEPAAAQPKEDAPAPKEEPAPAPAPAPEVVAIEKAFQAPQVSSHHVDAEHDTVIKEERKREREKEKKKMTASELLSDSEESDWDDIDENSLPESFMPSQGELFMSVDVHPGGMVTITPSRSSHDGVATVSDGKHKDEVVMVRKVSLDEYGAKIKEKEKEVMELSEKAKLADKVAAEKEDLEKHYNESIESLGKYQQEAETLRQALQKKMEEMTQTSGSLEQKLDLTVKEQQEAQNKLQQQAKDIEALRQHLNKVNSNLAATTAEAEARSNRMAELEMRTKEQEEELQKFKQITGEEKEKAARLRKEYEDQIKNMSSESQQLVADLEKTKKEKNQLAMQVEESVLSIAQLRKNLQAMEAQLRSANEEKKSQQQKLSEIAAKSQEDALVIQKMKEQAVLEEKKRRELHNLIQEIKGNIRVYIRIRPALKSKDGYQLFQEVPGSDDRGLEVVSPPEQSATGGGMKSKRWTFEFDRVFWPRHSQKDVFDEISQLVQSALDGYKVCIFAYGQTGSGKTFTMEGPEVITEESRGVIPRAVEQIFKHAKEMSEKGWKIDCAASFLEIYNTDIRDLLNTTDEDKTDLDIKLIKKGNNTIPTVSGLTVVPVASAADLNPLLKQASSKRATSATRSNDRSSRSHSVFQLRIHGVHAEQKVENEGILNLIDLAGSERVEKSEVVGARFEEAKAINSSLTCLGDVIAALANGAKHVPFRNSKLTYLLQDCFGGGSKTLMFINLAGELDNMQESISSLRFGSKVHECHIGSAKKDVKRSDDSKEAAPAAAPKKKK